VVYDGKPMNGENPYELNSFDISILGTSKRLSIPLGEPLLMRQVADLLRGLAMQLDHNSRRPDMPERSRRFMDKADIDSTNRKIKEAAKLFGTEIKEGRPATGKSAERYEHGAETVHFPLARKTHNLG